MYVMTPLETAKAVGGVLILALAIFAGAKVYGGIKESGRQEVYAQWDKEKAEVAAKVDELRGKLAEQTADHLHKQQEIADELAQTQLQHQRDLTVLHDAYAVRLRTSEARADGYRRQAQGNPAERDHLAGHAAKLDAALEEGRFLVAEFRATLGQRDREVMLLAEQIRADRKLMEPTE